jgi:two-component system NtrC family sensor kinase
LGAIDRQTASGSTEIGHAEIAERLQWLLRLRWLIVPVFVIVDLVTALLVHRRNPWTTLLVGAALIAANAIYSLLLARKHDVRTLLRWARFESALVTAIPVIVVGLHGDPTSALRYGVLVGVVGAAAVLPHTGEVAIVAMWAVCSLIVADAASFHFDPAFVDQLVVARWAMEAGIIVTVSAIAGHLHAQREEAATRLRETRARLDAARAEWEAAFDGVHDMIFVTDPEMRVVRANRAFAKVVGVRPHELAGAKVSELLAGHPERWWKMTGDGIQEIEDPLFDTLFEVSSTRLGDGVVHVARDVGEQRRLYSRLVQADKLAAVGVLASGVAHEINNPTAFVTSNLTELKRYVAAYEAAIGEVSELALQAGLADRMRALLARSDVAFARREAAGAIQESLSGMERIRQIVANLRSLARRDQAGEPASPVDLGEVVQAVVRTASSDLRAAAARVDVRGPLHVLGHRGELVDVVLNLVVNAVQAREEQRPNEISISLYREGSSAVIRVSDTGRGISASHMKRLFEPFFTTKAPGEGTGLGLSLARKIVLAHGGSIDVSSELGVGSSFTVRLPAHEVERATDSGSRRETVA